jgi:hypothetical protein
VLRNRVEQNDWRDHMKAMEEARTSHQGNASISEARERWVHIVLDMDT